MSESTMGRLGGGHRKVIQKTTGYKQGVQYIISEHTAIQRSWWVWLKSVLKNEIGSSPSSGHDITNHEAHSTTTKKTVIHCIHTGLLMSVYWSRIKSMFFTNCIGSCCLKERKLLVVGWVFEKILSRVLFFLSSGYNCDGEPIHFFFFFFISGPSFNYQTSTTQTYHSCSSHLPLYL